MADSKKISKLFNPKRMQDLFSRTDFAPLGYVRVKAGNNCFYWFKDNGANILAVAHLDSVKKSTHFNIVNMTDDTRLFSPVCDDRLGVYVINDILQQAGVKFDILLTTDEEIGQSTAQFFETKKTYNWMFQFDRSGNDVVMYDYEDDVSVKILEDCGFKVGFGSFSDICYLDHLGCRGFNFGTAYYDYHSNQAYAKLDDLIVNMQRFYVFYKKMKDVPMPYSGRDYSWEEEDLWENHQWDYATGKPRKLSANGKDFSWKTLGQKKTNKKGRAVDFVDYGVNVKRYDCRYCGQEVVVPTQYVMSWESDMMRDECCHSCYQHLMGK